MKNKGIWNSLGLNDLMEYEPQEFLDNDGFDEEDNWEEYEFKENPNIKKPVATVENKLKPIEEAGIKKPAETKTEVKKQEQPIETKSEPESDEELQTERVELPPQNITDLGFEVVNIDLSKDRPFGEEDKQEVDNTPFEKVEIEDIPFGEDSKEEIIPFDEVDKISDNNNQEPEESNESNESNEEEPEDFGILGMLNNTDFIDKPKVNYTEPKKYPSLLDKIRVEKQPEIDLSKLPKSDTPIEFVAKLQTTIEKPENDLVVEYIEEKKKKIKPKEKENYKIAKGDNYFEEDKYNPKNVKVAKQETQYEYKELTLPCLIVSLIGAEESAESLIESVVILKDMCIKHKDDKENTLALYLIDNSSVKDGKLISMSGIGRIKTGRLKDIYEAKVFKNYKKYMFNEEYEYLSPEYNNILGKDHFKF
jgi:hypothetical protein